MYYVFDLDGTLCNIDHRVHFVRGETKNYDEFFRRCVDDLPKQEIIDLLKVLVSADHRVEIWSGRSAVVEKETHEWLDRHVFDGASDLLVHMRPEGNYIADHVLKKSWLDLEDQKPDMIFDDRQQVVDMWRREGITCCQVSQWNEAIWKPHKNFGNNPLLTMMIGPSGSGKSSFLDDTIERGGVVSSDVIRQELCGDFKDQTRNAEVFQVLHEMVELRLRRGMPTIVDATNLKRPDRMAFHEIVKRVDPTIGILYVIINRPMEDKIRDAGWRKDIKVKDGRSLIEYHEQVFKSNLKDILAGDNMPNVSIYDMRNMKES